MRQFFFQEDVGVRLRQNDDDRDSVSAAKETKIGRGASWIFRWQAMVLIWVMMSYCVIITVVLLDK